MKNLEFWAKRARKLVAINSHADLFSSAAYLCLQQKSMSVAALSTLLEAVAKSIRHSVAMSTILATELFQAIRDAAIATSKLLLENSGYELRNAPCFSYQTDGHYSIAAATTRHPVFPYLDNWLIRDLIRNRLISHAKYCLQTVQSLGFIPNLKKSDLIPAQKFTFIGWNFCHSRI